MGVGTSASLARCPRRAEHVQIDAQRTEAGTTFTIEATPLAVRRQTTTSALNRIKEIQYDAQDPMSWSGKSRTASFSSKGALLAASQHSLPVLSAGHAHGFINAALTAFAHHYPISFSPDHVWLLILQAVSKHVEKNAEELRNRFVSHEGRKTLVVRRDDFVHGSPNNDWIGVVREFAEQLDEMVVPGVAERLAGGFSTTGLNEEVAAKVTVMELCSSYVDFLTRTRCGIPAVTLEGTPADWTRLRLRAEELILQQCLQEFAEWWLPSLLPVLDKVAASADGDVDARFWQSFVKRGSTKGSGAHSYVSGWINCWFPFTGSGSPNRWCQPYSEGADWARFARGEEAKGKAGGWGGRLGMDSWGADEQSFPPGISKAPATWEYCGQRIPMAFVSGFLAASQDPKTWALRPEVGWAAFERPAEPC